MINSDSLPASLELQSYLRLINSWWAAAPAGGRGLSLGNGAWCLFQSWGYGPGAQRGPLACLRPTVNQRASQAWNPRGEDGQALRGIALDAGRQVEATGRWLREREERLRIQAG